MLVQIYEEKIAKNMISERWKRSECLKSFLKITRLEMVLGDKNSRRKERETKRRAKRTLLNDNKKKKYLNVLMNDV